ncbi:MAG: hypothetical protein EOP76_16770 [Variovorax sp.]|jgi:hypothetical protein|nr:MAG: hypothetical protein EOP76_16770 [Variovorax sp.]
MKFVVVPELRGRWSWELRVGDEILATSAMSFGSRQLALVSIQEFRSKAPRSAVFDLSGKSMEDEVAGLQ